MRIRWWWSPCVAMLASFGAGRSLAQSSVQIRGLVDVVGRGHDPDLYLNQTFSLTTNFDALRARVFLEGGTARTRAFVQALLSDVGYSAFTWYGGYLQHRLFESREIYLEAGKIPVHLGTWAPRTYSNRNPLVGIPFAYYYKSTLSERMMPRDLEHLLSQRGRGQSGVEYTELDGTPRGQAWNTLPMMYDNCWDYGAFAMGSGARHDWAVGMTLGAPGAPVNGPDSNGSPSLLAKVGWAPVEGLGVHASFARGPYLARDMAPYLPAGAAVEDYAQTLWGASLDWGWRRVAVAGEVFRNHFDTPLRDAGLASLAYYLETTYRFLPGWYAAVRYDAMRFETVESASGPVAWDDAVDRFEAGVGYHATRELLVKAVAQINALAGDWRTDNVLPAVQVSFAF